MNVQAKARPVTAPERVYPLATVLNPRPYRSIRNRNRREAMLAAWLILVTAALAMLWLFN